MMRVSFLLAAALGCLSLVALAQAPLPPGEKKTDTSKSKDTDFNKSKGKESTKAKSDEAGKDAPKTKITLDKLKAPPGSILVIVDNLAKALELVPGGLLMSAEEYQKMQERIKALERQLKVDKKPPSSCKLTGKQDGDFLTLQADFTFATEQPKATVFLGLLGAHLLDEGKLDQQTPILEATDEGFLVRVDNEGTHRLTLKLLVRIDAKKSSGGGTEFEVELGLPGAAVTTLDVGLPANVKELRLNGALKGTKTQGRWQLGLGGSKLLALSWKQPLPLTDNAPLSRVEQQIKVVVDTTHVKITAELFLEDLRPQAKEQLKDWRLLLPPQALVEEMKPPPGVTCKYLPPSPEKPYHTLKLLEATSERWQATVSLRVPRPNPGSRLAIGPFVVLDAYQQHGTISVHMPVDASLGQRLIYYRGNEVYQLKNAETEATFQYGIPTTSEKNPKSQRAYKPPLELEFRNEKNQLETKVEHLLKLKTVKQGWEVDATTLIKVKALFSVINAIDLKLPLPRTRAIGLVATAAPSLGYPGTFPWGALWNPVGLPGIDPALEEFPVTDLTDNPLKLVPQDSFGKVRLIWERGPTKEITLKIKNTYRIAAHTHRLHLELPRPVNTQDRGARMSIRTDEHVELRYGPQGAEEPVPEKHHFEWTTDLAPAVVDFAWHPYQREVEAQAVVDVLLHEHTAQVRQTLHFPLDPSSQAGADAKQFKVHLRVPRAIDKVVLKSGGEITNTIADGPGQMLWIRPTAGNADKLEIVLEYDLMMPAKANSENSGGGQVLNVPLIWPTHVSRKDVKVRVWTETGGIKIRLTDELLKRGLWKERSIEAVLGKDSFPTLVLHGSGGTLSLALRIEDSSSTALAAFLAERGLIQVVMNDDGSQQCRARFLVRKINTHHLDVELPLPLSRFRDRPAFFLGNHQLKSWKTLDATETTVRVKLNPELTPLPALLEISYTIPADFMERNSSWRTTLYPPQFGSKVVIGQLRWQLSQSTPVIAAALGQQVRSETQWSLQGWLWTPEASVTSADLEKWLTGKEAGAAAGPVTFAFADANLQPHVIYHWTRQWWLLGCSGLLLIVALAVYLSPLPRPMFWLFLLAVAVSVLLVGVFWPAMLPPLLFGSQPGLVLLVIFVGAHSYWQERYRRRLVFLPAFSRSKPASTMSRSSSVNRPREASTVDAPAAPLAPEGGAAPSSTGSQAGS